MLTSLALLELLELLALLELLELRELLEFLELLELLELLDLLEFLELLELLEKVESLTHSLTYNLKSRDASASKNRNGICQTFYTCEIPKIVNVTREKRVNRDTFAYIGPLIFIIAIITITYYETMI